MEINIPLPRIEFTENSTYKDIYSYLSQLTIAINYARKAVENAEKAGLVISSDSYVIFDHKSLENSLCNEKLFKPITSTSALYGYIMGDCFDELQDVQLQINLS